MMAADCIEYYSYEICVRVTGLVLDDDARARITLEITANDGDRRCLIAKRIAKVLHLDRNISKIIKELRKEVKCDA